MRIPFAVALFSVSLIASGCHPMTMFLRARETHAAIRATGPMVIGFAPPVTDAAVDADPGMRSALEHWEMGLADTAACLEASGITVKTIYTDRLTVQTNNDHVTLEVRPSADAEGIGAYLVAPGKDGRLMLLWMPSAFVHALPGAAAEFFDVAACCTETARALHFCGDSPEGESSHPAMQRPTGDAGRR